MVKRTALIALAAALVLSFWIMPAGAATSTITMKDKFTEQDYSGNDGNTEFFGPWHEIGEDTDPLAGSVYVWNHEYCKGKFCAMMGGEAVNLNGIGLYRVANLAKAESAELRFVWGRQLLGEPGGTVTAEISADGGKSWEVLVTIPLDTDDGGLRFHERIDITEWAAANTQIRFIGSNGESVSSYFLVDDVEIRAEIGEGSTSTTSTSSTETSSTTSTTKQTPSTTTTEPHRTTSTTEPRTTTTTTTLPPKINEIPPPPPTPPQDPAPPAPEIPEGMYEVFMMKTGLAVENSMPMLMVPSMEDHDGGAGAAATHATVHPAGFSPVEGLAVSFSASAEDLKGSGVYAILLGILIAGLVVRGLKDRTGPEETI